MAGPKILDPNKPESPSVFDPWYTQFGRNLLEGAKFIVGETPQEQLLNTLTMGAGGPLVTAYKSTAARKLGTKAYVEAGSKLGPYMQLATEEFAKRFPRIAAHANLKQAVEYSDRVKGLTKSGRSWVDQRQVTPEGRISKYLNPNTSQEAQEILEKLSQTERDDWLLARALYHTFHEGTHIAQGVGNKDNREIYHLAKKLFGYENVPQELTAHYTGSKYATKFVPEANYSTISFNDNKKFVPAIRELLRKLGPDFAERTRGISGGTEVELANILRRRGIIPW